MSLTNRILVSMVAGILIGSLLNLLMHSSSLSDSFRVVVDDYLINGLLDLVGRIFVASLKLLVVPLVLVSLQNTACARACSRTCVRARVHVRPCVHACVHVRACVRVCVSNGDTSSTLFADTSA